MKPICKKCLPFKKYATTRHSKKICSVCGKTKIKQS